MSSAARTPGVIAHTGIAVSGSHKYVSLYVLLAGIIGGLLLILSLFLFCKYCRGKTQGNEGVGGTGSVARGDSWVLREASFSLDPPDDEDSIRERQETKSRRGSWTSAGSRYVAVDTASGTPRQGAEAAHSDFQEVQHTNGSSSRLVDDHGKTNIFLHRQTSFQRNESSPIKCFSKPANEAVECDVAVEIHPGPSLKRDSSTKGGAPLMRHASVSSINSCVHESNNGPWRDGAGEGETPWRASSTDWTKLETSLDFWRQEHTRAPQEDLSHLSKVRYNDTGSLEEVSVENCVDYFVEDEIVVHLASDGENLRQQYRRLWQLRATLEEDEDSKKPCVKHTGTPPRGLSSLDSLGSGSGNASVSGGGGGSGGGSGGKNHTTPPPAPSSPDQSPEPEAPGSHATSFDSNTEPLLDDGCRLPPQLLQLPSYETRRQNYRNILNWRLRRAEARNARRHGTGRQTSLEDTSFDSMETVDTEESSTDASRLDQATTSFESTTDNTESPTEQQVHRLQQLRADSGYRSLENPVPNSLKLLYPQQHVSSCEGEPLTLPLTHRIPSLGESFEDVSETEEGISVDEIDIEGCPSQRYSCFESEVDEGVAGLRYDTGSWVGRRRPGGQPTSKKRREFGLASRMEYARDYSVDEKSDALFREFSRCELDSKRQHRLTAYRRLRGPYPYPKLSEPAPDGFLLDDDLALASVPIIKVAPDEDSSDHQ